MGKQTKRGISVKGTVHRGEKKGVNEHQKKCIASLLVNLLLFEYVLRPKHFHWHILSTKNLIIFIYLELMPKQIALNFHPAPERCTNRRRLRRRRRRPSLRRRCGGRPSGARWCRSRPATPPQPPVAGPTTDRTNSAASGMMG